MTRLPILIFFNILANILSTNIHFKNNVCPCARLYPIAPFSSQCYYNPDVLSTVPLMAERHGYKADTHTVTTPDKYILTMFRIYKVNRTRKATHSNPIFIQHGLISNSDPWVDLGKNSLGIVIVYHLLPIVNAMFAAFVLVDNGYDVWLGNLRGTTYSKRHKTLSIHQPRFWSYTLDTLAEYDLPTQLHHVVEKSGAPVIFIGHSLGTTLPFMFASAFPKEAERLMANIVALAPVVYLDGVFGIEFIKPCGYIFTTILGWLHIKGLFYQESLIHPFLTILCRIFPGPCHFVISVTYGPSQIPMEHLPLFYSYWPTGISVNELTHYLQIASSRKFQKFDYGLITNLKKYHSPKPPTYNLTNIHIPVCLFYGENDRLFSAENMARLYTELGSTDKCRLSVIGPGKKLFSHMDFLYFKNMSLFYNGLFEALDKLEKRKE